MRTQDARLRKVLLQRDIRQIEIIFWQSVTVFGHQTVGRCPKEPALLAGSSAAEHSTKSSTRCLRPKLTTIQPTFRLAREMGAIRKQMDSLPGSGNQVRPLELPVVEEIEELGAKLH